MLDTTKGELWNVESGRPTVKLLKSKVDTLVSNKSVNSKKENSWRITRDRDTVQWF